MGPVAESDPERVLQRILRSRYFAEDPELSRVLSYICDETQRGQQVMESDIAKAALGISAFNPATDHRVREAMTELRGRLRAYFESEGQTEPLRLTIPRGEYRAFFFEAERSERGLRRVSALDGFWAPYLAMDASNVLVHSEIDSEGGAMVPLDELYGILRLVTWFSEQGASLEVKTRESLEGTDLEGVNLILTGSASTNPVLRRFVDPEDDRFAIYRLPGSETHGVVTVLGSFRAVQVATDGELMERAAAPFANGLPPEMGITL